MFLSKLAVVIWEIEQLIGFILEISCEKICTVFMGSKSISKNKDLFGKGKLFVQDIGQTVFTMLFLPSCLDIKCDGNYLPNTLMTYS